MNTECEQQALLEGYLQKEEDGITRLSHRHTKADLALMVMTGQFDTRCLLGAMDAALAYLESGRIGEARSLLERTHFTYVQIVNARQEQCE